ncbi:malonyl CoA-acyl carrier protein transacylase [Rhodococcus opacus PD630]|uniref:Malonyl CoA-acyl carrier protein transacylase n=4 Tax=Rhodococcus TaxID=1827 RepID=A0A2S8JBD9_RHOOP|nr:MULTISPECIES: ACP S-malonyltransferase [Rhodococcus]ELB88209.1 ACP S-malonyltransferase [Rhodococcus wratislaviensis IFP 2016]KXF49678.1 ACP S-malonyltransferase [Rhodococcus sp. SC4]RZK69782.1 MAG: ACP S-malonyltransferase [Rhodococcus sp. (in: high G+C Gram-positive bacteria)]ABG93025.1 [acyl-carrier protein] S-malonyltransferase [Rhodococcus jostii RHA1]EHI42496.1 malonyl CoA-acyl carrier protein transacylase [Rhodococcus opacus PD630]
MISLLAPGQGSQTPGMLIPWLELPGSHDRVALWSKAAGLDLVRLGTTATAEEITDTSVTQPLVVAAALLAFEELDARGLVPADTIAAGHSVGELAAAAVAGVLSADDAVALAAVRGAEMAKACALEPTGMSAVLGGDEAEVLARLDELGLEPANRNAAGQIVAAGLLSALEELAANPPEKARVRALPVAGAFHTRFMAPAQEAVTEAASKITPGEPTRTLLSNADGAPVASGADALTKLAAQVTRPVRWDLCTASLRTAQVSAIAELPPAGTLVGIAKREMRGTPTLALKTPGDISALAELTELG